MDVAAHHAAEKTHRDVLPRKMLLDMFQSFDGAMRGQRRRDTPPPHKLEPGYLPAPSEGTESMADRNRRKAGNRGRFERRDKPAQPVNATPSPLRRTRGYIAPPPDGENAENRNRRKAGNRQRFLRAGNAARQTRGPKVKPTPSPISRHLGYNKAPAGETPRSRKRRRDGNTKRVKRSLMAAAKGKGK